MRDIAFKLMPGVAFLFGYWLRGREIRRQKTDVLRQIQLLKKDVATWRGIQTPNVRK